MTGMVGGSCRIEDIWAMSEERFKQRRGEERRGGGLSWVEVWRKGFKDD